MLACSHHHFLGRKPKKPRPRRGFFLAESNNSIATEWGRFKIEVLSRFDQDALDPMKADLTSKLNLLVPFSQAATALRKVAMPKFDDPFLSYYERERASLLQQLGRPAVGKVEGAQSCSRYNFRMHRKHREEDCRT